MGSRRRTCRPTTDHGPVLGRPAAFFSAATGLAFAAGVFTGASKGIFARSRGDSAFFFAAAGGSLRFDCHTSLPASAATCSIVRPVFADFGFSSKMSGSPA